MGSYGATGIRCNHWEDRLPDSHSLELVFVTLFLSFSIVQSVTELLGNVAVETRHGIRRKLVCILNAKKPHTD
jgi:hypothetical protein